jgi:hypothetical protein
LTPSPLTRRTASATPPLSKQVAVIVNGPPVFVSIAVVATVIVNQRLYGKHYCATSLGEVATAAEGYASAILFPFALPEVATGASTTLGAYALFVRVQGLLDRIKDSLLGLSLHFKVLC